MFKKVFITGGSGFLGAYIIKELVERGYTVRALKRNSPPPGFISPKIFEQVEWISGDVLDVVSLTDGMQGVDAVIHAAAIVSFEPKDQRKVLRINIEGTKNVVNIALELGVKRLVHISSVAAIGRTRQEATVTEQNKWQPGKQHTDYAISKKHAENEVWRGFGEGMSVVMVNPSTIIGYGDWNHSSCALFKNVFEEFPWYTTGRNGFVGVEDVARATVLLMESEWNGERFIVNGENWTFRQLLNTIADGLGKKRPVKKAGPLIGSLAWRLEKFKSYFTGKRPLLTRQSARVAHSKTSFDNQKILNALPDFSFTPLETVIDEACKKYLRSI